MIDKNEFSAILPRSAIVATEPAIQRRTTTSYAPESEVDAEAGSIAGDPFGRAVDLVFVALLTLVFAPVIIIASLMLMGSSGPILFSQVRLGRGGRVFQVYKFRTMIPDAEAALKSILEQQPELRAEWEREFKLKSDPRVTPIGRFLRRTSLDELPQLWNVLVGDMSLVGPRPIEPFEISKYGRFAKHYYAQRPGLTGLWQVSGRSDAGYQRRIVLDAFYSKNRSFLLDLTIIAKTVRVVLKGQGAY